MTQFVEIECCMCGVMFAMTFRLNTERRRDGRSFFCPNGHSQSYTESETDKVRRERDHLKQQLAEATDAVTRERHLREETERRLSAQKGAVTRLRNRAAAGVCPCCNRSFTQLARHMSAKHPDFAAEEA